MKAGRVLLSPALAALALASALALAPHPAGGTEADPWGGMRAPGESPKAAAPANGSAAPPVAAPAAAPVPARMSAPPRATAPTASPAAAATAAAERPASTTLAIPLPRPRPAEAPGAAPAAAPAPEMAGRAVFDAEADAELPAAGMFDAAVNAFPPAGTAPVAPGPAALGAVGALQAAVFPSAVAAPVAPSSPPASAASAPDQGAAPQAGPAAQPAPAGAEPVPDAKAAAPAPQGAGSQDQSLGRDQAQPESPARPEGQAQQNAQDNAQGNAQENAQDKVPEQVQEQAHSQEPEPDHAQDHSQDHAQAPAAGAAQGHGDGHGAPAAHEPPRDTRPMDLLRRLQRLQDRLAAGTSEGLPAQRDLISQIDAAYAAFPQEIWQDERNARALAVYFLSGGTPGVLRRILDREPAPAGDIRLLRGILAYAEGRGEEALRFLGEVDARAQPNALGGQIALAQAALVVRQDPGKASDLLDLARLLLPGTLIEEAALRRQILVESQSTDITRFERLTRQYLFRFRHSVYAGNFRQRFAAALTRMAFVNDPAQFSRLEEMLKPIEPEGRRDIYLLIARAALTQGRTTAAELCAQRTLALAPPASLDAERARLYGAAATAASASGYEAALKALAAVDRSRLDPSDIALLDAASEAGRTVRDASRVSIQAVSAAAPPPAIVPPPAAPTSAAPASPAPPEEPDAMKGARARIEAVDALLKEAPR